MIATTVEISSTACYKKFLTTSIIILTLLLPPLFFFSFSAESLLPANSLAGLCGFQRRKDKSILFHFHVTQVAAESCHASKPLHRDSA